MLRIRMTDISEAVNVGPVLTRELRKARITTVESLRALGYLEAWRRLHRVAPNRDCTSSCLALAGAIKGVRWMKFPAAERARIVAAARRQDA
jgi:DNA transformation protein